MRSGNYKVINYLTTDLKNWSELYTDPKTRSMNTEQSMEDRLWEYIDGHSGPAEIAAIEQLLTGHREWQEKYKELLNVHQLLNASDLDAPSMRFTRNVMEEIARHREGIGLAELSKLVGLHNSTTFHLAKTMVSLGYIRQERDSKRYRVGRPLFALAASALDEIEMVNLATPILEDLSRETGESGHFAVRMGDAVIVIARTSGPGAFQLTDRVGVVRPAHCTALGKIILASLRPDQLKRFLERVELKPSTKKSITDPTVLLKEIAEIRRSAIAIDDGEYNAEVRCIAVPVYNFTGDVIGALGISGPIWRMTDEVLKTRAKQVQQAANRLSAEFGAQR